MKSKLSSLFIFALLGLSLFAIIGMAPTAEAQITANRFIPGDHYVIQKNVFNTPKQYSILRLKDGAYTPVLTTITGASSFTLIDLATNPSNSIAYGLGMENNGQGSGVVEVIDVKAGTILKKIAIGPAFTSGVSMSLSPDYQTLAVAGNVYPGNAFIQFYETKNNTLVKEVQIGLYGQTFGLKYSPDARHIYIQIYNSILIYDVAASTIIGSIPTDGFIRGFHPSNDGVTILINQANATMKARVAKWNTLTYTDVVLTTNGELIDSSAASSNGKIIGILINDPTGLTSYMIMLDGTTITCTIPGSISPNQQMLRAIQYGKINKKFYYIEDSYTPGTIQSHGIATVDKQCNYNLLTIPMPPNYNYTGHVSSLSADEKYFTYAYVPIAGGGFSFTHSYHFPTGTSVTNTGPNFTDIMKSARAP